MPCGGEGNRRSGVVLAMCHRLLVYPPWGSKHGDEYRPHFSGVWLSLPYLRFRGGSVAEWLAFWIQAQKVLGSNRSRDAVG